MEVYGEWIFIHYTDFCNKTMKDRVGFSTVELLVAIAIFIIIIAIPFKMFIKTLKTTTQQYEISKSSIEKLPVSEILTRDIETAGVGLPFKVNSNIYSEVNSGVSLRLYTSFKPSSFNNSPSGVPKAIDGNVDSSSGYSYLVLRSSMFGLNKAANHWTYIFYDNKTGTEKLNIWNNNSISNYNNLKQNDEVIILDAASREIKGTSLFFKITKDASPSDTDPTNYGLPNLPQGNYLVYGISDKNDVAAPFNRVDYALYDEQNSNPLCAQGTHTLGKILFNNNSSGSISKYPILRCVADFEVWFGLDNNTNIAWTQDLTSLSALKVREQLKRVVVFILIQNGQYDRNYIYPYSSTFVGDSSLGIGHEFHFNNHGFLLTGTKSYKHYRWKLLEFIVKPINLEGN